MNNKRTMKFMCIDGWNRPVYKCIETDSLWKDTNLGESIPDLHSCQNQLDGEPESPIKKSLEIIFIDEYKVNKYQFEYMMLDRLRSDCDYFLGYGNRSKRRIVDNNVEKHIEEMKRLYNLLPVKPEWLSYEQINKYEQLMTD